MTGSQPGTKPEAAQPIEALIYEARGAYTVDEWDLAKSALVSAFASLEAEKERLSNAGAWFEFIKHGEQNHQDWLREALQAFIDGKPKPELRGLGRHGALIAKHEATIDTQEKKLEAARGIIRRLVEWRDREWSGENSQWFCDLERDRIVADARVFLASAGE